MNIDNILAMRFCYLKKLNISISSLLHHFFSDVKNTRDTNMQFMLRNSILLKESRFRKICSCKMDQSPHGLIALKIRLHLQGRLLANVVQSGAPWEF